MKATSFSPQRIGKHGLEFVKSQLSKGDELSALLLSELSIDEGRVTVYAPPDFDIGGLDLNQGFVWPENWAGLDHLKPVVDLALGFLDAKREHIIVCEGESLPMDYSVLPKQPLGSFIRIPNRYGAYTGVYRYLRSDLANDEYVRVVLSWARHYPRVIVLSSTPYQQLNSDIVPQVDKGFLRELALRTEYIVVGACDEQMLLTWNRSNDEN